jgi:hypothetical protein
VIFLTNSETGGYPFLVGGFSVSSQHKVDLNEFGLKSTLEDILRHIREDENPAELNAYRSLFKKNVPLYLRSYVAAYLLRSQGVKALPRHRPAAVTTIFVSIGKNRRVFPRDLVLLATSAGNISKGDIGDIKVLDNYSFIDVEESLAQAVISRLDGLVYRGRKLAVNYAKKRSEEGERPAASIFHEHESESIIAPHTETVFASAQARVVAEVQETH